MSIALDSRDSIFCWVFDACWCVSLHVFLFPGVGPSFPAMFALVSGACTAVIWDGIGMCVCGACVLVGVRSCRLCGRCGFWLVGPFSGVGSVISVCGRGLGLSKG